MPKLREGQATGSCEVKADQKFTNPPPRYNPSSLLRLMEEQQIGTKATRADIIDTLGRRGYVEGEPVTITDLGLAITEILQKYSPQLLSVEMTRQLEQDMERIQFGDLRGIDVLSRTIDFLKPLLEGFKSMQEKIGKSLDQALQKAEKKSRTIGSCPNCGSGELIVIRNWKTGKRFVGCTNYQSGRCRYTAPLPQMGVLQATDRRCRFCGFPILIVRAAKKRPWQLCVNTNCQSNQRMRDREAKSKPEIVP